MTYEVYCLDSNCDFSATESDVKDADSARRLHADQTGHQVELQFEGEIRADGGLPYGDVAERDRILARLEELTDDGPIRMKARRIGLGTSLSAVQIGQYLTNLPNEAWPTVDVEVYSRSNRATVWEVRPADVVQTDDALDQGLVTDGGSNVDGVARLDVVGPYEDNEYPYMNFECPSCGFSICEWTQCPECGWYDGAVWEETMGHYNDCRECGQTIPGSNGYLCDGCDRVEVES